MNEEKRLGKGKREKEKVKTRKFKSFFFWLGLDVNWKNIGVL